jgi:hypothetical protein
MAVKDLNLIHTDKYLTNFATAYKQMDDVADFIAPPFSVKRASDKYLKFQKDIYRIYDNKVGRRAPAKEIYNQADEATYSTERYKLSKFIDKGDMDNVDEPLDLERQAAKDLKTAMMTAREYRVYSIAGSASVITQTVNAGGDWDTAASGEPVADILTGIKTIYESTGMRANRIVMPFSVAIEAIKTAEWKDYFKYTGNGNIWDLLAGLRNIGLEGRIAGAFGLSTNEGAASDPTAEVMWGDSVLVYYCEPNPTTEARTLMYSPNRYKDVVQRFNKDEEDGVLIQMSEEIDELLVDATCGYLITNCL